MLDRKKLYVDIKSVYRGSRVRGFEETLDSPIIIKEEGADSLQTPCLTLEDSFENEEEVSEAANFFLSQPTPDIEMRGLMSNPFLTTPTTSTNNSSHINHPLISSVVVKKEPQEEVTVPVTSSSVSTHILGHQYLHPSPRSSSQRFLTTVNKMDSLYNQFLEEQQLDSFLEEQHQQPQQQPQVTESLSTPVVNPNFGGNPFQSFRQQNAIPASIHLPFNLSTGSTAASFDDNSFVDESAAYHSSSRSELTSTGHHQHQHESTLQYAPPPHSSFHTMETANVGVPHASLIHSDLPESVLEQSFHRPVSPSVSHSLLPPYSPSGSSSISSQVPSPSAGGGHGSRSGSFSQDSSQKRKRSTSDEGGRKSSGGRPTKKQQLDMLCGRKKSLENQNHQLREDVAGYERACRRLKDMLYQRIRDRA